MNSDNSLPALATEQSLRAENAELRARLEEAQDILRATRPGVLDALVVEEDAGTRIFTLQGLDAEQCRLGAAMLAQVSDAVLTTDREDRITFLNPAAEQQYRVRGADMLGRKVTELYTRQWPSPEAEAAAWAALEERSYWRGEKLHCTRDGRVLPVEASIAILHDPETGERTGLIVAIRDITERKQLEQEKAEALRLLDTLLTRAPIGFTFLDRDLRFVRINERLAEINGLPVAAHLGKSVAEIVPTLEPSLREVTERILATGLPVLDHEFSGETTREAEVTRYWNENWYPVHDGRGEIIGFGGVVEEITERKRAEEALRRDERRFRGIFDSAFQFIGLTTPDGTLLEANQTALEAGGLRAENVIGKPFWECDWWTLTERTGRELRTAIGRAASGEVVRYDVDVRGAEGRVVTIDFSIKPIRDEAGRVVLLIPEGRDITDLKRAVEALRVSEARLSGILRQSPAGIVQTDAAGCLTLVNPRWCAMFGYTEAEMLGRNILELTHPSSVVPTAAAFSRLAAGGPDFQIEKAYSRKDGSVLSAQSNVAAIRSPDGEFLGLIAVVLDITERLRSDEELHRLAAEMSEADRRKDVFLATLAHELRNPLAPMRNGLQIMKLAKSDGDAGEQVRAMMDRQLSQMVRLVDDLLDVSRITQGKVELRVERIDLKTVLGTALEGSRPAIEEAGHELTVVVPDEPIFVDGDEARLAQVVSNLLNNSAKYTRRGGHIRMTVWREDGMAVVAVKDNGIGIPPAMLDRVFDMFMQVDRALEKTTGGLGIGLSLVKGLLEMHGGTVEVKSDGEGMGSEFVIRLPVVIPVVAAPERESGQSIGVVPFTPRRILVVDDNVDSADSLGRLLEMWGNEVRTANDGEAGIAEAAQFRPDVVLMDIGMPKLNGYEAARRIRQHPLGAAMVLVALTGWGQEDDRKKSADAGFNHHLVKPVDVDALIKLMSGP